MQNPVANNEPTVFIIDDDPAVRHALSVLVGSMQLQAESYGLAKDFLDLCDKSKPGCVLLDVRMPEMSGLELLRQMRDDNVHLPVILISAHGDVPMVVQAMKAGALNFLEKPCRDQELWEAIQEALKWDAENRRRIIQTAKIRRRLERLTQGEHDVLIALINGKSNKAIAAELGLSVRTIEVRRAKVMQKMKAHSLAELVRATLLASGDYGKPQSPCGSLY